MGLLDFDQTSRNSCGRGDTGAERPGGGTHSSSVSELPSIEYRLVQKATLDPIYLWSDYDNTLAVPLEAVEDL